MARLTFDPSIIWEDGTRNAIVSVEFQNVSRASPLFVCYKATDTPLKCKLHDSLGKEPQRTLNGSDGMTPPFWLGVTNGLVSRLRASGGPSFGPTGPFLLICIPQADAWTIKPGVSNDYFLSGTLSVAVSTNASDGQKWEA